MYRLSSGLVSGPKALWLSADDVEAIEVKIIIDYLLHKGLDEDALAEAIEELHG